ncbi:MAG: TetR/AcrR family transcriptional regulator [Anaerolineaceae bacterium]|nr:TetR/AcrR family transcriptional regulator [Anaerolineaceae bacterium]
MTQQPEESNRRDAIIQAAVQVFAEKGFHSASIKEISAVAGLKSPSLIYWYFKDKGELLQAVLSHMSPLFFEMENPEALLELHPESLLLLVARGYIAGFENPDVKRIFRIVLSEALRDPTLIKDFSDAALRVLNFFTDYLQYQVKEGRLRPHDSASAARSFIGGLLVYVLARDVIAPLSAGLPDVETYITEQVHIFINGLRT